MSTKCSQSAPQFHCHNPLLVHIRATFFIYKNVGKIKKTFKKREKNKKNVKNVFFTSMTLPTPYTSCAPTAHYTSAYGNCVWPIQGLTSPYKRHCCRLRLLSVYSLLREFFYISLYSPNDGRIEKKLYINTKIQ